MNNKQQLEEVKAKFNKFDVYRNNKNGNLYYVDNVGRDSEDTSIKVAYVDKDGDLWFRPWKLFLEKFTLVNKGDKKL